MTNEAFILWVVVLVLWFGAWVGLRMRGEDDRVALWISRGVLVGLVIVVLHFVDSYITPISNPFRPTVIEHLPAQSPRVRARPMPEIEIKAAPTPSEKAEAEYDDRRKRFEREP